MVMRAGTTPISAKPYTPCATGYGYNSRPNRHNLKSVEAMPRKNPEMELAQDYLARITAETPSVSNNLPTPSREQLDKLVEHLRAARASFLTAEAAGGPRAKRMKAASAPRSGPMGIDTPIEQTDLVAE